MFVCYSEKIMIKSYYTKLIVILDVVIYGVLYGAPFVLQLYLWAREHDLVVEYYYVCVLFCENHY